jgi:hypothetical protein
MSDENTTRRRETIIILSLALLVGGGTFLLLLASAGAVAIVLPVLAVLLFFAVLHYLLWGRKMARGSSRQDQSFAAWLEELNRGEDHEEVEVIHAEKTVRNNPADHRGPRPGSPSAHSR